MFKAVKKFLIPCKENNYRPQILEGKILIYVLLLACFLRLSAFLFFWQLPNTGFFADISRVALIDSLNDERSDLKLEKLKENSLLNKAAFLKANDMMQKGYFSHVSPTGITPWYWFKKVGYDYKSAGENLGIGYADSSALHQAWNESPSHKANLISNKYKEVGIAFLEGNFNGSKTTIVVQLFGTQKFYPALKPEISPAITSPVVQPKPVIATTTTVKPTTTTQATTSTGSNSLVKPSTVIPKPVFKALTNQGTANLVQFFASTASAIVGIVAGETTTSLSFLASSNVEEIKGFWPSILKFFAKDYNGLTQTIVLIFLVITLLILVLNIVIKIFVQHYDLIIKATLIAVALLLLIAIGPKQITMLLNSYVQIF